MMGSTAYRRVSSLMKDIHSDSDFYELYGTLSHRFDDLVDIMTEVSDANPLMTNQNIIKSYGRYLETGREDLEKS